MAMAAFSGSEDLSFKLQQALLENHVRLDPVIQGLELLDDHDNPQLSYIQSLLEEEDVFEELEKQQGPQQIQKSYEELVNELTSIISSSSSSSSSLSSSPVSPGDLSSWFPTIGMGTAAFANWSRSPSGSRPNPACPALSHSPKVESSSMEDLEILLMRCARAVVAKDSGQVHKLVAELRSRSSPPITCLQRAAAHFTNALVARLTGYGAQMHSTMYRQEVTQKQAIICQMNLPTLRSSERFANQVILEHCRGAKRVHIVDYGILYGCQWPSLIKALSERAEGPPLLMITGIDFPHIVEASSQTGQGLVEYAKSCGVSLEFHFIGSNSWEAEEPKHHLENELLIANCKLRLRNLRDDGIPENPRKVFYRHLVKMKVALFVQCEVSVELTSPFFIHRFQEAWTNFSAKMEYIEESMRIIDESKVEYLDKFMAKSIMNVVACEGTDRIERLSSYRTWNSLAVQGGLESLPPSELWISMATSAWSGLPGFTSGVDNNWLLLGWKTEIMNAMAAWRPKLVKAPEALARTPRRKSNRVAKCQPLYLKV